MFGSLLNFERCALNTIESLFAAITELFLKKKRKICFIFLLAVNLFKISKSRHQKQITPIKTSPLVKKKCVPSLSSWPLYPSYYLLTFFSQNRKKKEKEIQKGKFGKLTLKWLVPGGSFTFAAIVTLYDFMSNIN